MSWHIFHRNKKAVAKIDCSTPICLDTEDKNVIPELLSAEKEWQKSTAFKREKSQMVFNDEDCTKTHFRVYFTPYTLERFMIFYKHLVNKEQAIPHMSGAVYKNAPVTLSLYYDSFIKGDRTKDKNGQVRRVVNSQNELKKFQPRTQKNFFLSSSFDSILLLVNRLIFFYNYTSASLTNQDNPKAEYNANRKLAIFIRKAYIEQHPLTDNQIATIPSPSDFKRQKASSVFIPSLVSPAIVKHAEKREVEQKQEQEASRENEATAKESLSPLEKTLKAESDRAVQTESASASSKSSRSVSQTASDRAVEASVKADILGGQTIGSSSAQSAPAVEMDNNKSNQNSASKSNQASQPNTNSSASASSSANPIDIKKFSKDHFPRTNQPKVIQGAIQLLLDKDPNAFQPSYKFQKFAVNKKLTPPAPIKEAIKTGKLDNQRYVIQMDNQYKKTANQIIKGREHTLNMRYARMITDLLYGAYTRINNKVSFLLSQATNDKLLLKNAQHYYNVHYNKAKNKLENGRKNELKMMDESLWEEYQSKKLDHDRQINAKYSEKERKMSYKVDDLTKDVFYRAKKDRNKQLRQHIRSLKDTDMNDIRLQIQNHKIEFAHKMSKDSQLLFKFLNKRLQVNHSKAIALTSKMINKQIKLNESRLNLRQANSEIVKNKADRRARAKWAKEQQKQQSYVDGLNHQIDDYTSELTGLRADSQQAKAKLNQTMIKNHSLKDELNNANKILENNKTEISKGHNNLLKYQEAKRKVKNQEEALRNARQNFTNQNSQLLSKASEAKSKASKEASVSASLSASSQMSAQSANAEDAYNSYQVQIFTLKNQLTSASQANGGDAKSAESMQNHLNHVMTSFNDYRTSVSASTSVRNSMIASQNSSVNTSLAQRNRSYQDNLDRLHSNLNEASLNNLDTSNVSAQLNAYKNSISNYKASVSMSNATRSINDDRVANSAKVRDQSYANKINGLMTTLNSASQANDNTSTIQMSLNQVKNSFSNYQNSVSVSNSLRNVQMASLNATKDASYQDTITRMSSNAQQAVNAYNQASLTNNENNSGEAERIQQYKDKIDSYKTSFANYKSSLEASIKAESQSISASNSVTKATLSRATLDEPDNTSRQTNASQGYVTGADEVEQHRLEIERQRKEQMNKIEAQNRYLRAHRGRKHHHMWNW